MTLELMLAPRDLRLFRSKAAHDKTPIITRHLCTSRQPVRDHFTLKKYETDGRCIDRGKLHLINSGEARHRYGRACSSAAKPTILLTIKTSIPITIQSCNAVMFSSLRIDGTE